MNDLLFHSKGLAPSASTAPGAFPKTAGVKQRSAAADILSLGGVESVSDRAESKDFAQTLEKCQRHSSSRASKNVAPESIRVAPPEVETREVSADQSEKAGEVPCDGAAPPVKDAVAEDNATFTVVAPPAAPLLSDTPLTSDLLLEMAVQSNPPLSGDLSASQSMLLDGVMMVEGIAGPDGENSLAEQAASADSGLSITSEWTAIAATQKTAPFAPEKGAAATSSEPGQPSVSESQYAEAAIDFQALRGDAAEQILDGGEPTLLITTSDMGTSEQGAELHGALRFSSKGSEITLPVLLKDDGEIKIPTIEISDDGQVTVRGSLKEMISSLVPQSAGEKAIHPTVTVLRKIVIADPKRFAKAVSSDAAIQNANMKEIGEFSLPQTKTVAVAGGESESQLTDKDESEKSAQKPVRIPFSTLSAKSQEENGGVKLQSQKIFEQVFASKQAAMTPQPVQTVQQSPQASAQLLMPESTPLPIPVKFDVQLPRADLKISEMSTFNVNLKPESLGHMKVSLTMTDGQLNARLSVESTRAKQAVEASLPELRTALQQHGIKVEQFSVNVSDSGFREQAHRQRRNLTSQKNQSSKFSIESTASVSASAPSLSAIRGGNLAGVLNLVA